MFNKKKSYFLKKLSGVEKMIWDTEFKRFKTIEIREGIRQDYDQIKSKLSVLTKEIDKQKKKPTKSKDERKRLDDSKLLFEEDIKRFEGQMKGLDREVHGAKPTNEDPNGFQGLNDQIEALHELKEMIRSYVKEL